jgi:NitT/TauT family transport system permease protein
MNFRRILLAATGLLGFLVLWHVVITLGTPPPQRTVTIGFSDINNNAVRAIVLGDAGLAVAESDFKWDANSVDAARDTLVVWFRSFQPRQAALPPGELPQTPRSPNTPPKTLWDFIESAKAAYGGGLVLNEIAWQGTGESREIALARARQLQETTKKSEEWLPTPVKAFEALWELILSGEMMRHIIASLFRVAAGFILGAGLGIPLGLAMGSFASVNALLNSIIQCLRPISPIAWLPVAALTLRGSDNAAVFIIFLSSFFPITVSTAAAVATLDLKYRRSARNFGIRGIEAARTVIIPGVLPSILTALRIALGISWVVVVAAEMLGVTAGLGYLVLDARNQLRFDRVVAAMIVIGLMGLVIDVTIQHFHRQELERRGL